jgi:hypothetical protein
VSQNICDTISDGKVASPKEIGYVKNAVLQNNEAQQGVTNMHA